MSLNWERSQSSILSALSLKCEESSEPAIKALKGLINDMEEPIKGHLSLVSSQLPSFDIHDISHCYKLVENIEKMLTVEQLKLLDPFELFLIYASCLLHDSAMALPEWEYTLLKCCEGQEGYVADNLPVKFLFDETPLITLSVMKEKITNNKEKIYNFKDAKDFIFCYDSEDALVTDLAERAIAYVEYRNGFNMLHEMKDAGNYDGYREASENIRCSFIRDTHHERVVNYIKALKVRFVSALGGVWAKGLVDDLGAICRSHGEKFDYVLEMDNKSTYFKGHRANLPFICALLRLSDILHFSYDRAPLSLFAEKQIIDVTSRMHWKAKLQGVSYDIKKENELITVVFSAYCEDPDSWYFLRDYIKDIEWEIQNYNRFYRENQNPQYFINIQDEIDSIGIKYDSESFTPDDRLHFSLDQGRILDLLMGVKLYKDKYFCLRELYQNALDACRVMCGFYPHEYGKIEFGMGSEIKNDKECRFVYCLDNGSGMDKDIIIEHFLKIGNSYYNSQSFRRQNINSREPFQPVSQFGIGVLSCFMIGDTLDITTCSMKNNEVTRFIINGPNEHFYYTKPNRQDLDDLLTTHGTLVKIFLKEGERLNNEYLGDKEILSAFFEYRKVLFYDNSRKNYDLLSIVQSYIFDTPRNISISVRTRSGFKKLWNINTQIADVCFDENTSPWSLCGKHVSEIEKQMLDSFDLHKIFVNHKGIEYHSYLALPITKDYNVKLYQIEDVLDKIINPFRLLIDGIVVNDVDLFWEHILSGERGVWWGAYKGICFCFNSSSHLELSVDRTEVVHIPEGVKNDIDILLREIAKTEVEYIWNYLIETETSWDSDFASEIWNMYFELRNWNLPRIMDILLVSEAKIYISGLCDMIENVLSLDKILKSNSLELRNIHLIWQPNSYNTGEYLVSNLIWQIDNAISKEDTIQVEFNKLDFSISAISYPYRERFILNPVIAIKCYSGKYAQYDFVNSLYPFIPQSLFNRICVSKEQYRVFANSDHKKLLFNFNHYNIFDEMRLIKAKTIYPDGTMFTCKYPEPLSYIGYRSSLFDTKINFGYNESESLKYCKTILYCYFTPEPVTKEDEKEIEYYQLNNPKYIEGVRKGWSVLIVGKTDYVIAEPGIVKKAALLKKIDDHFWERNEDESFYFPDGTIVTKEYVESLNTD